MRIHLASIALVAGGLAATTAAAQHVVDRTVRHELPAAYQGRNRGPDQTERFSRRVKVGRDGRVSVGNIAGDIVVTGGSGDEVSIEAIKRTRGDKSELGSVQITVDERAGRVDVRTEHSGRNDHVSVDYTLTVPTAAAIEIHSISGTLKVTNVQGPVRAETISGDVTTSGSPHVEVAKSVSGNVELTGGAVDGEMTASTISGDVRARGVKARALALGSVSGDVAVTDAACERLEVKSVSGNVEYSAPLARGGSYNLNSHSGTIRVILVGDTGFELNADTFSGSIHSDIPLTLGASARDDRRRFGPGRRTRATFGDGSAALTVRTFSGDINISKRQ